MQPITAKHSTHLTRGAIESQVFYDGLILFEGNQIDIDADRKETKDFVKLVVILQT